MNHETAMNKRLLGLDDLVLDLDRNRVRRGTTRLKLSGLSFRLLAALVRKSPRTVTRRELTRDVWGSVIVSDDTLRQRVRILRQELGSKHYIENVKGIGYRAGEPVVRIAAKSTQARPWLRAAALAGLFITVMLLTLQFFPEFKHAIFHSIRH